MQMTRRQMLAYSAATAGMAAVGFSIGPAMAAVEETEKAIAEFAGGATPETGRITLTAPEIAENGNTVPISVEVDSAMSGDDLVESVTILAEGNPNPEVCTFHFTEMSGSAAATTRMRLAQTQNVIALAKMKDGSVFMDKKLVKVTIGGCGG
ncbi:thiosulfate oxidation carrier protein SoxY [Pseudohoeflea coraliihabitans]|uniref:Thiosulfate oxidation carrier protein SoxY n=1 Tax=Pseudohoeflea coraliihabitans TaxID=2860393 RepID=A0ABS6WQZ2_9HYPH|nr:thiosulfate oxidation carrier protein SoxY [Pseudohoeflea sp. DP4N28-3]MBW3098391.1 thiosulfate oxidation carrier protein SoxY [Pseudohoeflea sp. DP4N28-3]